MNLHRAIVVFGMMPLSIMCAALWVAGVKLRRKLRRERRPFSEKVLRTPGYGLWARGQQVQDNYVDWMVMCIFTPMFLTAFAFATNTKPLSPLALAIIIVMIVGLCFWRLTFWHRELSAYQLGLSGERLVAASLDDLREHGYKIFHSYPLEKSDVDHIVVGPTGVFAIETKTRSKKPGRNSDSDYKVVFDGQQIVFPRWADRDSPEQAKRQAEILSGILCRRLGHKIDVAPVLAIPGWYATEKVKSNLRVLNPKLIPAMIRTAKYCLSKDEIRNICGVIEEKCRDMEL
jgi:Nuclease-related domain